MEPFELLTSYRHASAIQRGMAMQSFLRVHQSKPMSRSYILVLILFIHLERSLSWQSSQWSNLVQTGTRGRLSDPSRLWNARRPRKDEYDEDEYYDNDDNGYFDSFDNLGGSRQGLDLPSSYGRRDGWRLPESVSKALLAGVFVLGVGLGVTIDSQVNTNPRDLASRDAIDQAAPNANLCSQYGASAMAFDERVFVTFNPFNVYVSQADVKPACVLRESNVVPILQAKKLIKDDEVRACKQNMNTWAFVGNLEDTPQLSCVYRSKDAQNEFLSNPKLGIGEDYLDDDREKIATLKATGKIVKGGLTDAQKEQLRKEQGIVPIPSLVD